MHSEYASFKHSKTCQWARYSILQGPHDIIHQGANFMIVQLPHLRTNQQSRCYREGA